MKGSKIKREVILRLLLHPIRVVFDVVPVRFHYCRKKRI